MSIPASSSPRLPATESRRHRDRLLPPSITVVFADDHPLFRAGLARGIASHLQLEIVGEATDGQSALMLIEELEPDVALLDVAMPGLDGLSVCRRLSARAKPLRTRVVLLSAFLEPDLVSRAVLAGAAGYLGKDASREEICDALVIVAGGGAVFSPDAAPGVVAGLERLYAGGPRGERAATTEA